MMAKIKSEATIAVEEAGMDEQQQQKQQQQQQNENCAFLAHLHIEKQF